MSDEHATRRTAQLNTHILITDFLPTAFIFLMYSLDRSTIVACLRVPFFGPSASPAGNPGFGQRFFDRRLPSGITGLPGSLPRLPGGAYPVFEEGVCGMMVLRYALLW